ncbi:hypothetical protein KY320_01245, partial [Candidatus Woesearchaeota archaeon]|nr:hypothetical protein [Candidatus Woesearchaeota archaeon]
MQISVVEDISECEELWKRFSPGNNVWELWDVAYSLYSPECYKPYFIVLKEDKKEIGLLPLWFDN